MTLKEFVRLLEKENKHIKRVIRDGDSCIVELEKNA